MAGSIYCDISWKFPISNYQPTYWNSCKIRQAVVVGTSYLLTLSSKQSHQGNQIQFHCDNLSTFDWLCAPRTAWQLQSGCFLQWHELLFKSLPLWSTLVMLLQQSVYFSMIYLTWMLYIKCCMIFENSSTCSQVSASAVARRLHMSYVFWYFVMEFIDLRVEVWRCWGHDGQMFGTF